MLLEMKERMAGLLTSLGRIAGWGWPPRRLSTERLTTLGRSTLQAVSKHLKVLAEAGLVSRTRDAQRRPVHLEAEVFDLMTKWIERYRREAEERYRRLDGGLQALPHDVAAVPPTEGAAR